MMKMLEWVIILIEPKSKVITNKDKQVKSGSVWTAHKYSHSKKILRTRVPRGAEQTANARKLWIKR